MWEGWMWHFWGEEDPTGSHFGFCSRGRQLLPLVRNCHLLQLLFQGSSSFLPPWKSLPKSSPWLA